MDCSPWGHKESGTSERLILTRLPWAIQARPNLCKGVMYLIQKPPVLKLCRTSD